MHSLESYLRDLHDIRSTGAAVKETSYYPPLANLLNAVGQTIKPRVRCVINLKNQGAGMPDGGLFTPDQFQRGADVRSTASYPAPFVVAHLQPGQFSQAEGCLIRQGCLDFCLGHSTRQPPLAKRTG